ncbi:MAG: cation diffusion facilitator family transporter [Actinobacteria bacterium]|jgi:cation diffusion facilitator family transporter|nr:MAG: cation diffusion facilitator family transporter [Actinomycetota bacterium]
MKVARTEKAEVISIAASVLMAAGMIAVAIPTGSIAILAEGIDTVVDIVASLAVLAGLRLSQRHSRNFPAGLYKLENLIGTGIGILILVCAYELAAESIRSIIAGGNRVDQPWLVMGTMAAVLAITASIAWYKGKVGREEHSPSLSADAHHAWTDAIACLAIVVGVGLEMLGIPDMDSVAALVVVAFLIKTGIEVTLESLKVLLDASIERDVLARVRELVMEDPHVREVVTITGRNSGSHRFIDLSLVPLSYDLKEAERTSHALSEKIRREIDNVDQVNVDFTVEESKHILGAVLLEGDGTTPALGYEEAPLVLFVEIALPERTVLYRRQEVNPAVEAPRGRGIRLAVFLSRSGIDVLLTRQSLHGDDALYVLESNGVEVVFRPDIISIEDAVEAIRLRDDPGHPPL